jgi:hypothetical protein
MVQHRQLNLLQDFSHLGVFDIIFCRNVLIYFDQNTKVNIFERLSRMLEPDGVLALGAAESVVGITNTFKPYPDRRGLYRPNIAPVIRVGASTMVPANPAGGCRSALSLTSPWSARRIALHDRVRQETRRVAGDRVLVLADRQAAWRVIDQPASDHRILIGEARQRRERLPDESFRAVRALLFPSAWCRR